MHFHHFAHSCSQGEGFGAGGSHRHFRLFGRRRRLFDQGDIRLILLKLVSEKPSHGYELIKEIEQRLGGAYAPSPGIVYPALTLLEEEGLIRVESTDGPRKLYAVTPEGAALLEHNRGLIDAIFGRIDEVNARHGGGPAPQILRALQNLRLALRLRLSQGPLSAEQVSHITAILDSAAREIEAS
ncbi:MAG TPA: PadR family transcriptional regulator [Methylocella sp.]|nr:PadR family transcriptional regulator [Methylocella sp.]